MEHRGTRQHVREAVVLDAIVGDVVRQAVPAEALEERQHRLDVDEGRELVERVEAHDQRQHRQHPDGGEISSPLGAGGRAERSGFATPKTTAASNGEGVERRAGHEEVGEQQDLAPGSGQQRGGRPADAAARGATGDGERGDERGDDDAHDVAMLDRGLRQIPSPGR